MKIIIINKYYIYFFLIFIIIITGVLYLRILNFERHVYKDRARWEETGEIIWEVNTGEKLIAFTFDDGPSPTFTPQILNLLAKYNARATFFVNGKEAEKFPEIIKRQYNEGHEIANHTYSHKEVNQMSEEELLLDLKKAHQVVKNIINKDMKLFRPTSGYYDETIVKIASKLDYKVIIWTWGLDSKDWLYKDHNKIAANIYNNINPGNIVLFHDRGGNRENTIKTLHILLPLLQEKGYQFVTVSDLLNNQNDKKVTH